MSVTHAAVLGAAAGLGLALLIWGLVPPRPGLARSLHALSATPRPVDRISSWRHLLATPLSRLGLPRAGTLPDLNLLHRDPVQHLAQQSVAAIAGMGLAALVALAWAPGTPAVPAAAAIAGAGGGLWLVQARLHAHAATFRAEIVHTLGALLDLISVSLAGGAGIEQALADATSVAQGRAADLFASTLDTARLGRITPWQALSDLGQRCAIAELDELAAALTLAGTEGARVRASLTARAQSLRTRHTIAMQDAANAATERMTLPLMLLGAAFMIFLLYPAVTLMGGVL